MKDGDVIIFDPLGELQQIAQEIKETEGKESWPVTTKESSP